MTLRAELTEKLVEIIDSKAPYKFMRRPYDEEFAEAHGLTMDDITGNVYIPCLKCGDDIVPKLLTGKRRGKAPVYCSTPCREEHASIRIMRIDERTNVNQLVDELIRGGYDIVLDGPTKRTGSKRGRVSTMALMLETNSLLNAILEELKRGKTR